MKWTYHQDRALLRMHDGGVKMDIICDRLGRPKEAVDQRLTELEALGATIHDWFAGLDAALTRLEREVDKACAMST